MAIGATTERGCLAEYANHGEGLDMVAPGGGSDGNVPGPQCAPFSGGRAIFQLTIEKPRKKGFLKFGYPDDYEGCSMASAHVAGAAALVWAQLREVLGRAADARRGRGAARGDGTPRRQPLQHHALRSRAARRRRGDRALTQPYRESAP